MSASVRASGQAVSVKSIALKAGEYRVYNLEVEQEHRSTSARWECWCIMRMRMNLGTLPGLQR